MSNNKLTLSHQARMDIAHYIRLCDYEIGGFGYVTMDDKGDFFVDEIFLAEQTVTGTTVDFTDAGMGHAIQKAMEDDRVDDLRFCWHSHVNMGAFWSKTDETMIENLNTGITPFFVSLVQNKSGKHEQRVDFFPHNSPLAKFSPQVTYELDLYYLLQDIPDRIKETYAEMVTVNNTPITLGGSGGLQSSTKRVLSQHRREYLVEKVAESGYQSLSNFEQEDYDDMIYEEIAKTYNGQGLWDDDMQDAWLNDSETTDLDGSDKDPKDSAHTADHDKSDFWDDDFKPDLSEAEKKALNA